MRLRLSCLPRGAVTGLPVLGALIGALFLAQPAAAQTPSLLYLGVDSYHVMNLAEPASKVAVANPSIADVQVINPSQLLIAGRSSGVTTLVVFSGKAPHSFNVVVHPSSMVAVSTAGSTQAPHPVLVQRGDKMSEQLFTRDPDGRWLELGQVKPETDAKK
jgi:putative type II/III system pilus formation protein